MIRLLLSLLVLVMLASCAGQKLPDKLELQSRNFSSFTGWNDDQLSQAIPVFLKSCSVWENLTPDHPIGKNSWAGKVADWLPACRDARTLVPGDNIAARQFFEQDFTPFKVTNNGSSSGLFTGYYEIELHGSMTPDAHHMQPLYKMPPERVSGQPYYTRKEIDEGILAGKGLELVYVDDPVRAFSLHIQGSGRILFDDGHVMRVGYAGQNGQPYVAIGRLLIDSGAIDRKNLSAHSIEDWLHSHPDQAMGIMQQNPSYVFFKDNSSLPEGPIGAQGVAITPGRSMAVDRHYIAMGMPLWLESEAPRIASTPASHLRRLFIAQDTGGAIKGVVRGDLFFGNGPIAEELASNMKHSGSYTILLPRAIAPAS